MQNGEAGTEMEFPSRGAGQRNWRSRTATSCRTIKLYSIWPSTEYAVSCVLAPTRVSPGAFLGIRELMQARQVRFSSTGPALSSSCAVDESLRQK